MSPQPGGNDCCHGMQQSTVKVKPMFILFRKERLIHLKYGGSKYSGTQAMLKSCNDHMMFEDER